MTDNPEPPYVVVDGDVVELYQHGPSSDGRCMTAAQAEDLAVRLLIAAREAQHLPFEYATKPADVRLALRSLALIAARVTGERVRVEYGDAEFID